MKDVDKNCQLLFRFIEVVYIVQELKLLTAACRHILKEIKFSQIPTNFGIVKLTGFLGADRRGTQSKWSTNKDVGHIHIQKKTKGTILH